MAAIIFAYCWHSVSSRKVREQVASQLVSQLAADRYVKIVFLFQNFLCVFRFEIGCLQHLNFLNIIFP